MSKNKRIYDGFPNSESVKRGKRTESGERKYPDFIKEAQAAYQSGQSLTLAGLLAKKQGEYTAEDYYALPEDCRVELIDGVIYNMAAPALRHQTTAFRIAVQLDEWIRKKNGQCVVMMSPADVQLDRDERTMVQPDVFVVCKKENMGSEEDGKGTEKEKGKKESRNRGNHEERHAFQGAPDFVAEVLSPSSEKRDWIVKYRKYKNAGVREYWIVDPETERITVHLFHECPETAVYSYQDEVPVHIFGDGCSVSLKDIGERDSLLDEIESQKGGVV